MPADVSAAPAKLGGNPPNPGRPGAQKFGAVKGRRRRPDRLAMILENDGEAECGAAPRGARDRAGGAPQPILPVM